MRLMGYETVKITENQNHPLSGHWFEPIQVTVEQQQLLVNDLYKTNC